MQTLRITCHNCGAVIDLTPDIVIEAEKLPPGIMPWRCPHCIAQMNPRTWNKLVWAFWTLSEVNKDLRQWHEEYDGHPLFQAEVTNHYVPREKILI